MLAVTEAGMGHVQQHRDLWGRWLRTLLGTIDFWLMHFYGFFGFECLALSTKLC